METNDPVESPQPKPRRKLHRSFFTKKLERKFEEKGLEVPQRILSLMDVPFEDFTPEDRELYESKIKPLSYVFVEHLMEVYETMGKPQRGWEDMLQRCEPSPIKVLATLVIHEDEKVQELEKEEEEMVEAIPNVLPPQEKISVRPYVYGGGRDEKKERWWEKKIF